MKPLRGLSDVLVFGCPRTGTNAAHRLVTANWGRVKTHIDPRKGHMTHKHTIPNPEQLAVIQKREPGIIVLLRDPYAWFVSRLRWLLFRKKWLGSYREDNSWLLKVPQAYWAYIFEEWNTCYRFWLTSESLPERHIVRCEDLLGATAQQQVCKQYVEAFGWQKKERYNGVSGIAGPHGPTPRPEHFDIAWVADKKYLDLLTPEMLEAITESIDWDLIEPYGYLPLEGTTVE